MVKDGVVPHSAIRGFYPFGPVGMDGYLRGDTILLLVILIAAPFSVFPALASRENVQEPTLYLTLPKLPLSSHITNFAIGDLLPKFPEQYK